MASGAMAMAERRGESVVSPDVTALYHETRSSINAAVANMKERERLLNQMRRDEIVTTRDLQKEANLLARDEYLHAHRSELDQLHERYHDLRSSWAEQTVERQRRLAPVRQARQGAVRSAVERAAQERVAGVPAHRQRIEADRDYIQQSRQAHHMAVAHRRAQIAAWRSTVRDPRRALEGRHAEGAAQVRAFGQYAVEAKEAARAEAARAHRARADAQRSRVREGLELSMERSMQSQRQRLLALWQGEAEKRRAAAAHEEAALAQTAAAKAQYDAALAQRRAQGADASMGRYRRKPRPPGSPDSDQGGFGFGGSDTASRRGDTAASGGGRR